jgi:beta-N-acetylhexosaminidase
VIYFGSNVVSEQQLSDFSSDIDEKSDKYPALISVDQEGGIVERLSWDDAGSHKEIAKLSEEEQCQRWRDRSETLRRSGINWNFGIVADVTTNMNSFIYPRTFSTDYAAASESVEIAVNCSDQTLSTIKHWPGHGSTPVDTHQDLGVLAKESLETWNNEDNLPFSKGISSGADSVMVGHLIFDELTGDKPASLSKPALDYLRDEMSFEGLIVTDDMNMLTASGYSLDSAVSEAFMAGNDIILVAISNPGQQAQLINTLKATVKSSEIDQNRIDRSVFRILEAKNKVIKSQDNYIPANLIY